MNKYLTNKQAESHNKYTNCDGVPKCHIENIKMGEAGTTEHLPEQSGLRFQRELAPRHQAVSGRRKPHRAAGRGQGVTLKYFDRGNHTHVVKTYLRVRHLIHVLIGHVHLERVDACTSGNNKHCHYEVVEPLADITMTL